MKNRILKRAREKIRGLSLSGKVLLTTLVVFITLTVISAAAVDFVTRHNFDRLERRNIADTSEKLRLLIRLELKTMLRTTYDYAVWSDTWHYIRNGNPAYLTANITPDVLRNLQIQGVFFYHSDCRRQSAFIASNGSDSLFEAPAEWDAVLSDAVTKALSSNDRSATGIVLYGNGTFLVSAHQILPDGGRGPMDGVLLHIRSMDDAFLAKLSSIMGYDVRISDLSPGMAEAAARRNATKDFFADLQDERLELHTLFREMKDAPAVVLSMSIPRDIHAQGAFARKVFFALLIVLTSLAGVSAYFLIHTLVFFRLKRMASAVADIRATLDLSKRLDVNKGDELDDLGLGINEMLSALEKERASRAKAEREKDAMQEYLLQSRKMEALGTMAGGIAHDFNNILGSILGSAELLRYELPEGSPLLGHVERIEKAGSGAVSLVRQMLSLTKGHKSVKTYFSMQQAIHETLDLMKSALPPGASVEISSGPFDDMVYADLPKFQQAILNLAANASHAMTETAEKRISIALTELCLPGTEARPETRPLAPGRYILMRFTDSGAGMDDDVKRRLFEPFYSTKDPSSGRGLGLSVVHRFVTSNGGTIAVESEKGGGTSFFICLPAARNSTDIGSCRDGGRSRVMLVDDDLLVRKTLASGLRKFGYEIVEADSGEAALKLFAESAELFDAVVTDQMMPGMTGQDMTRKMKLMRPNVPVILVSGYASGLDESAAGELFSRIIMKPVGIGLLGQILGDILSSDSRT